MKILMLLLCSSTIASAQNFNGIWQGRLQGAAPLRIAFTFTVAGAKATAMWQSPDQTLQLLPTDSCYIHGDSIFVTAKKFHIAYRGKLVTDSTVEGVFTQGADIPLVLKKIEKVAALKRPQTPQPPFSYNTQDVKFYSADKLIRFAGTLTWPKKDSTIAYVKEPTYPSVILISGSGPQDRNSTLFGHKSFAVLADYLTKKGFAVLRTDDRGVGGSTGNFANATSADFADDAEAALDYLKTQVQIDTAHIGFIGHSEGGLIAPVVAARRKDVHHIVLLAGPGIPIIQLMGEQVEAVAYQTEKDSLLVKSGREFFTVTATEVLKTTDTAVINKNTVTAVEKWATKKNKELLLKMKLSSVEERKAAALAQVSAINSKWYRYFIGFDPQPYLTKLSCNVLALNGSKDIQVLPASNLAGIKASLKKSQAPHYEVKEMPGLNHLFQTCTTCTVQEYAEMEETFSPAALNTIADWLLRYGK